MSAAGSLPPELEAELAAHFKRTRSFFEERAGGKVEALVLGGGYGRGEGGVAADAQGNARLFNDLDYFVFTSNPEDPGLHRAVSEWERAESGRLGIDVEGKCLPRSDLEQTPGSMMFFDLVSAHTVVMGPPDYLAAYQSLAASETIAAIEATRLMWNRGSGLLFALADLQNGCQPEVVHRNQSKAKLAIGDALLTIRGQYRPYVQERREILDTLAEVSPSIRRLHGEGAAFKLRPTPSPEESLLWEAQRELTELWLRSFLEIESERLGTDFDSPGAYARYRGRLFPETPRLRNRALHLRDRLRRGGGLKPSWDYPRSALQRALVLLLADGHNNPRLGYHLGDLGSTLSEAVSVYSKWWHHYS